MSAFALLTCNESHLFIKQQQPIILDIRDAMAYQQGHIPGAIHTPQAKLPEFVTQNDKSRPVVVYCYRGNSSKQAAQYLCDQGFCAVYSLEGGFQEWAETAVAE